MVVIAAGNAFPDTGEIVLQIAAGKCALFRLRHPDCPPVPPAPPSLFPLSLDILDILQRAIPRRRV